MASYKNFTNENNKHKNPHSRTNIYNPAFNTPVQAKSETQTKGFEANIEKWTEFVSWARFYPDLWWDLITPPTGGITLGLDQRIFLRCVARFLQTYGVFPRGYGKTFLEVMGMYHACIFYPNLKVAMTAQTKENAAKILKEKHDELVTYYPKLDAEILKMKSSNDSFECHFHSGGVIDVLVNAQSSKGSRRKRINIEESALLNNRLFEDVLEPIPNVPRPTIGPNPTKNPEEMNGQINFWTTSGFRGSDEWERSCKMFMEMAQLKGKMVIGASWQLGASYSRGETEAEIMAKKAKNSPTFFAQNYESKWVGAVDGALVSINTVMLLRTLIKAELEADGHSEYIIAMDVAHSENTNNNQSSLAILKLKRARGGKILKIQLVNIVNLRNGLNFTQQAVVLKKLRKAYNAKIVVIDGNGLGVGMVDEVLKETIDPKTGESLGCWATINNPDKLPELDDADEIVYDLKANAANNHDIIINFKDMVESAKVEFLKKTDNANYDIDDVDFYKDNILPHIQTDMLVEEIANLKMKQNNNGKVSIEKAVQRTDKDRYSALAYGLYYIKLFEDSYEEDNDYKAADYFFAN